MSDLEIIADFGDLCGEGPLWDARSKALYWTDAVGAKFYQYDWTARSPRVLKEELEICGFTLNEPGGFVITNSKGIWLWDGSGDPQLVAGEVDGIPCPCNDCIADPAGRLFAGSIFYDPSKEYQLGHIIRVDTDGSARIVDEGIHLANGFGFSPDCKTLYFTDSALRRIYAYDYRIESGEIRNRRTLVQVSKEEGIPDGMTVDSEGFLWSAQWFGSCVVRYDPDGKLERRIAIPAKQTSSVALGGPNLQELFITSAGRSEVLPVMPPGYDPDSGYFGGRLYRFPVDVDGKEEFRTRISRGGE
ncbi:MAG: SMP-30/gluconolactonase/LRE family protein [Acidobacteriota bacterium]